MEFLLGAKVVATTKNSAGLRGLTLQLVDGSIVTVGGGASPDFFGYNEGILTLSVPCNPIPGVGVDGQELPF